MNYLNIIEQNTGVNFTPVTPVFFADCHYPWLDYVEHRAIADIASHTRPAGFVQGFADQAKLPVDTSITSVHHVDIADSCTRDISTLSVQLPLSIWHSACRGFLGRELLAEERLVITETYIRAQNSAGYWVISDSIQPVPVDYISLCELSEQRCLRKLVESNSSVTVTRYFYNSLRVQFKRISKLQRSPVEYAHTVGVWGQKLKGILATMGEVKTSSNNYGDKYSDDRSMLKNSKHGRKKLNENAVLLWDYSALKGQLKAKLKAGDIIHSEYNRLLAALKKRHDDQLRIIRQRLAAGDQLADTRSVKVATRVMANTKGSSDTRIKTKTKKRINDVPATIRGIVADK